MKGSVFRFSRPHHLYFTKNIVCPVLFGLGSNLANATAHMPIFWSCFRHHAPGTVIKVCGYVSTPGILMLLRLTILSRCSEMCVPCEGRSLATLLHATPRPSRTQCPRSPCQSARSSRSAGFILYWRSLGRPAVIYYSTPFNFIQPFHALFFNLCLPCALRSAAPSRAPCRRAPSGRAAPRREGAEKFGFKFSSS